MATQAQHPVASFHNRSMQLFQAGAADPIHASRQHLCVVTPAKQRLYDEQQTEEITRSYDGRLEHSPLRLHTESSSSSPQQQQQGGGSFLSQSNKSPSPSHHAAVMVGSTPHRGPRHPSKVVAGQKAHRTVTVTGAQCVVGEEASPIQCRATPNALRGLPSGIFATTETEMVAASKHADETTAERKKPYGLLQLKQDEVVSPLDRKLAEQRALRKKHNGAAVTETNMPIRDWRDKVPFMVPVHPEVISYDPTMVHSEVLRYTKDCGQRAVPKTAALGSDDTFSPMTTEFGVKGMSLRKHSIAHRMSHVATYPGFVPQPTPADNDTVFP